MRTVITGIATLVDTDFSVHASTATIVELDNSTDLWPLAVATLKTPDTWSAAPTVGTTIDLYMCRQDASGGTEDEDAPAADEVKGAKYVGSFGPLHANDVAQTHEMVISLAGVRKAKFYVQNNSGVSMAFSAGFTVEIEGFTYTPST